MLSLLDQALANPNVSLETIQTILQQQPELMGPALIGKNYNLFIQAFTNSASLPVVQYLVEQFAAAVVPTDGGQVLAWEKQLLKHAK